MMNRAKLQVQDITGNWVTVGSTFNQDQYIFRNLQSMSRMYKRTARAIDKNGNILQMT